MKKSIRSMESEDIESVLGLVKELAVFEELENDLIATAADYENSFFGSNPVAWGLVAEVDGQMIGYALYFRTFSSFIGRPGIWLEDLYVKPEFRGLGIGKDLLKAVGKAAKESGAGRYEWCVLDWNQNAIDFYQRAGAQILDEWRIVRVSEEGITALVES
ncbi:MAG: GNAT family N-acetyltransferase [Verrucomicrobiota bacterium]